MEIYTWKNLFNSSFNSLPQSSIAKINVIALVNVVNETGKILCGLFIAIRAISKVFNANSIIWYIAYLKYR